MEGIFRKSMITQHIVSKCPSLEIVPEITPGNHGFSMIDSGGVEVEIGEFLYALLRVIKPNYVLETGTYHGLSSTYMGMALKANGKGTLTTLDPYTLPDNISFTLWRNMELENIVFHKKESSLDYVCTTPIDVLFLDSEPYLRFKEFVKYFDLVSPGGIIMIHDLHPHLSYTGLEINGMKNWPYGDFRETIGPFIKQHQVQVMSFTTPRGFTMFQKTHPIFSATKHLNGEI